MESIVYIQIDNQKNITDIISNNIVTDKELISQGYIPIDKGEGLTYNKAQLYYFLDKFGLPLRDKNLFPNFKYTNEQIIPLSTEEKKMFFINDDVFNLDKTLADIYIQLALLQKQNDNIIMSNTLFSDKYYNIKRFYDLGFYQKEELNLFVSIGWLQIEEKANILKSDLKEV